MIRYLDDVGGTFYRIDGRPGASDQSDALHADDLPWQSYRPVEDTEAVQMDAPFEVHMLKGTVQGSAGDYLCRTPGGGMFMVKKELFEATFRRNPRGHIYGVAIDIAPNRGGGYFEPGRSTSWPG